MEIAVGNPGRHTVTVAVFLIGIEDCGLAAGPIGHHGRDCDPLLINGLHRICYGSMPCVASCS